MFWCSFNRLNKCTSFFPLKLEQKMDSLENKQGLAKNNTLKSNEKRLQSLKSLKKAYQNQKSIIQSALSSIDKASNKIIFDEEYTESTPNNSKSGTVNKGKTTLFEDESDEDNIEIDFSYKQQFEGEEGQKVSACELKN